jgi:hypothetical protein
MSGVQMCVLFVASMASLLSGAARTRPPPPPTLLTLRSLPQSFTTSSSQTSCAKHLRATAHPAVHSQALAASSSPPPLPKTSDPQVPVRLQHHPLPRIERSSEPSHPSRPFAQLRQLRIICPPHNSRQPLLRRTHRRRKPPEGLNFFTRRVAGCPAPHRGGVVVRRNHPSPPSARKLRQQRRLRPRNVREFDSRLGWARGVEAADVQQPCGAAELLHDVARRGGGWF